MMSTSSPSTDAARAANAWCRPVPFFASTNTAKARVAEIATSTALIGTLTVATIAMAPITVRHGGSAVHETVFSSTYTALAVAEMRLERTPGGLSAKNTGG